VSIGPGRLRKSEVADARDLATPAAGVALHSEGSSSLFASAAHDPASNWCELYPVNDAGRSDGKEACSFREYFAWLAPLLSVWPRLPECQPKEQKEN